MGDDVRYAAYIHYEYLCERYDRTLPGHFNKYNEWIPRQLGFASVNAHKVLYATTSRYKITFKDLMSYMKNMPPMSYERATEEYKRLVEPRNIQINIKKEKE